MTVMVAVSSVVFATDYTSLVKFYEKNADYVTVQSYGSTTIKAVEGDVGVARSMSTNTGVKNPGETSYTYAYSTGYYGTYKSGSTVESSTYSRSTKGWEQLYSIHNVFVNDGASLNCTGTMTSATGGCYSWDGSAATYLYT